MRFNPPPNWPQPPAGWSPPAGWEPDPSWPQPPPGWPLWIADDEFIISPYRATRSRAQATEPWHRRTVAVVLLLIFFFPVGLVLLWLRHDWSVRRRAIVTAVIGLVIIIALPGVNAPTTTTTALSPTTISATTSSPPAPTASQPVVPSPLVTTSRAPVTSAPPKTTIAAAPVVHTSAAPVHTAAAPVFTTQSPQPVQTTAQNQGCYPRTNGGNCYKPGEFCRSTDHGVTGTDANGAAIKCEDNDGWRWERV